MKPLSPVSRLERPGRAAARPAQAHHELTERIHTRLLERADLAAMQEWLPERLRAELRALVGQLLTEDAAPVNAAERQQIIEDIQNEVLGYGPLEPLLQDPGVSDILVNTHRYVYVERQGRLHLTDVRFRSNAHVMKIIDKMISAVGRRVDESSPMVDARLPDGSRLNAVIPPLALDGPLLSIRRFHAGGMKIDELVRLHSISRPMAELFAGMVRGRLNFVISGGTGSGKTTLLNALSSFIPASERIVTIEDAAELRLQQEHVVRLETRPANLEGKGEVTTRALLRNSLRMRPDRIIVGEVRGAEALDMLQAMNTGHEGSMTTVHANSPREALTRLEHMIGMAGVPLSPRAIQQQICSAITVVIQIARLSDGTRKVTSVQELTGMEGGVVTMQEIFRLERGPADARGAIPAAHRATNIRPKFCERLREHGVVLPENLFSRSEGE